MKLKTLKDFEGCKKEDFYWACEQSGGSFKPEGEYISKEDLKQEAIKWVLDIRNSIPSTSSKKEDIRCFSESWIKHFFNITEENLMTNEEINNRENGE